MQPLGLDLRASLNSFFFSALSQGTCVVLGIWEPGAITDNNTDLLKVGRMV